MPISISEAVLFDKLVRRQQEAMLRNLWLDGSIHYMTYKFLLDQQLEATEKFQKVPVNADAPTGDYYKLTSAQTIGPAHDD